MIRTVANRDRPLVIADDVEIRLVRLSSRPARARRLVVARLHVENVGERRFRWPSSPRQIAVYVREELVAQTRRGRAAALRGAEGPPAAADLRPGEASEIAAAWSLPPRLAAALRARGSAIIVIPPSEVRLGGGTLDSALRIGVLRLWK